MGEGGSRALRHFITPPRAATIYQSTRDLHFHGISPSVRVLRSSDFSPSLSVSLFFVTGASITTERTRARSASVANSQFVHSEAARRFRPLEFLFNRSNRGAARRAARGFSLQFGREWFGLLDDHVELRLAIQPTVWHHHGYPAVDRGAGRRCFPADHAVLLRDHVGRAGRHADPFLPVVTPAPSAAPDNQAYARYQGEQDTHDDQNEDEHRTAERAVARLVIGEARRHTVHPGVQAQKCLRGLADGLLRYQRRWHGRVLSRVESRVDVGVVEHVVLPHG